MNPPELLNQSFYIAESSDNETIIGTINATHHKDKRITFSIIKNVDPDQDGDGDR